MAVLMVWKKVEYLEDYWVVHLADKKEVWRVVMLDSTKVGVSEMMLVVHSVAWLVKMLG